MAILFLFDHRASIVPVPGTNGTLTVAKQGAPLVFVAPDDIAGFYLQVQNAWLAADPATLTVGLTLASGSGATDGSNLIQFDGLWTDWSGQPGRVTPDSANNRSGPLVQRASMICAGTATAQ